MRRQEIDHILTTMLESHDNVSDLNITVEKPFQVESSGQLVPVALNPPIDKITPFQAEIVALWYDRKPSDAPVEHADLTLFGDIS